MEEEKSWFKNILEAIKFGDVFLCHKFVNWRSLVCSKRGKVLYFEELKKLV